MAGASRNISTRPMASRQTAAGKCVEIHVPEREEVLAVAGLAAAEMREVKRYPLLPSTGIDVSVWLYFCSLNTT